MTWPTVDEFLEGPRARSLCIAALGTPLQGVGWHSTTAVPSSFPWQPAEIAEAVAAFAGADIVPDVTDPDPMTLFPDLLAAVDSSRPWQPPDHLDAATEVDEVRAELRRAAAAVLASPAAAWWRSDCAVDAQWFVEQSEFDDGDAGRRAWSIPEDSTRELSTWHRTTLELERRYERDSHDRHPGAAPSGEWWSTPRIWGGPDRVAILPSSSRRLGPLGAVELSLEEDSFGPRAAVLRALLPPAGARVYEVHSPADWVRLVDAYPMSVRWTRRGTWWQSTGQDAQWLIPDYAAVAGDWDAIHLSPLGYLTTAGRALPVDGGATVLAGWDPDATFWLTDVTLGERERWVRRDGDDLDEWVATPDTVSAQKRVRSGNAGWRMFRS